MSEIVQIIAMITFVFIAAVGVGFCGLICVRVIMELIRERREKHVQSDSDDRL